MIFGQHQFRDAARIGKGRVENRNAALFGRVQIHLIGADAEAAHAGEARRALEELAIEVGRGADADEVRVRRGFRQFPGAQRLLMRFDIAVAIRLKPLGRARVDAFQ